jgi:Uma2 family endonuclease
MLETDFLTWNKEGLKVEFVDGNVIVFPSCTVSEDMYVGGLSSLMGLHACKHRLGIVLATRGIAVRLRKGLVRSPDIVYLRNSRKDIIRETYFDGAPDLVVELVSLDSVIRDWHEKYIEYEAAGVREYWIIDPPQKRFAAFVLSDDHRYHPLALNEGKVFSQVLSGFWLKPDWFLAMQRVQPLSKGD